MRRLLRLRLRPRTRQQQRPPRWQQCDPGVVPSGMFWHSASPACGKCASADADTSAYEFVQSMGTHHIGQGLEANKGQSAMRISTSCACVAGASACAGTRAPRCGRNKGRLSAGRQHHTCGEGDSDDKLSATYMSPFHRHWSISCALDQAALVRADDHLFLGMQCSTMGTMTVTMRRRSMQRAAAPWSCTSTASLPM